MNIRRTIAVVAAMLCLTSAMAQIETQRLTYFKKFMPAKIKLASGKTINNRFTNIGLKNASLLYLQGELTMEANMKTIVEVHFDSLDFMNINGMLAECLDTVGDNQLFCAVTIDMQAYEQRLKNNRNITSMDMGDAISYSTIDLESEDERTLPLIPHFFYRYNGKIIKVHERDIKLAIPKERRYDFKAVLALPSFSWTDRASLAKMLRAISRKD